MRMMRTRGLRVGAIALSADSTWAPIYCIWTVQNACVHLSASYLKHIGAIWDATIGGDSLGERPR